MSQRPDMRKRLISGRTVRFGVPQSTIAMIVRRSLCALLFTLLPTSLIHAATASIEGNVVQVLATGDGRFGGCMAALDVAPADAGLDCAGQWVTFSCTGEHAETEDAARMFESLRAAVVAEKSVEMRVTDEKKHGNYCHASRIKIQDEPHVDADSDGDGVLDLEDDVPLDASETIDTDDDGVGNNADTDDDNDGVVDDDDAFPLDPSESVDTDGDGIGDNADPDDDNDGVSDADDPCPLDKTDDCINRAPVSVGSITDLELVAGGEAGTVDVAPYFSDPDGHDLSYSASTSDAEVAIASVSGNSVTVAPVAEGTAEVTITARDPGALSAEQTFTVNVSEEAGGMPDLVVVSASVSDANPDAGESFRFSAAVRNSGTDRAAATTLRYYRSPDSSISRSDSEVGTDAVGSLDANRESAESIDLSAPSSAGTYYYGACVDSVSGESNTGNNCSAGVRVAVREGGGGHFGAIAHDFNVSDSCPGLAAGIATSRSTATLALEAAVSACRDDGGSEANCRKSPVEFQQCAALHYCEQHLGLVVNCTVYSVTGPTLAGVERPHPRASLTCRFGSDRVWKNGAGKRMSGCNSQSSGGAAVIDATGPLVFRLLSTKSDQEKESAERSGGDG